MVRALELALTLLPLAASVAATPSSLWHVDIDYGPAPPPEEGPPLSAHASRDKALLPAQICGILGGYLLTVLILGVALLTYGKKMRRQAHSSKATFELEMVRPSLTAFDQSPISPKSSLQTWIKGPDSLKRSSKRSIPSIISNLSGPNSPSVTSAPTFDAKVIEHDREERQKEMERLYAAVMEHDQSKSQVVYSASELPEQQTTQPASRDIPPPTLRTPPKDKRLLRIMTDVSPPKLQVPNDPASSASPRSPMRAIYPPDSPLPIGPSSPTSPINARYPSFAPATTPLTPTLPPSYIYPSPPKGKQPSNSNPPASPRTSSIGSAASASAASSSNNNSGSPSRATKARRALRNLRISAPIQNPTTADEEERTPLSPRFYPNLPPPPSPPTPHTGKSLPSGADAYEELDRPQPLPRPAPQRGNSHPSNVKAAVAAAAAGGGGMSGIATTTVTARSAGSSRSTLPLRSLNSPGLPASQPTYLEPRRHEVHFFARNNNPNNHGAGVATVAMTPRTGGRVPMTPYSPYMPFTPVTPVTPHLVTRAERKAMRRAEGRKVKNREEDLVEEEGEMWGEGY